MKTLKWATIKRYSTRQIYKHLDKFQDANDVREFDIDWHYENVWQRFEQRRWSGLSDASRDAAIEALYNVYRASGLIPGVDFEDYESYPLDSPDCIGCTVRYC